MGFNGYSGQLRGPFTANQELIDLIQNDAIGEIKYVKHLGIQADITTIIKINGEDVEIGKTGIYEIGNTEVTSIYFLEDTDDNAIIDYTIILKEEE